MRKFMILLFVAGFALLGAALAQTTGNVSVLLAPTTGGLGNVTVNNTGTPTQAAVSQTVELTLPQAYGIAIDEAATLNFDLGNLVPPAGKQPQIVCVSGIPNNKGDIVDQQYTDQTTGLTGWLPMGTWYTVGTWPNINVQGNGYITSYPPITKTATGAVDVSSKTYLVCYKSFVLEKFTNVPGWTLTVSRKDADPANSPLGTMYVQDNVCSDFGGNTTLQPLPDGATNVDLLTGTGIAAITQTTGQAAAGCGYNSPSSWLNDLIVLAIEVDGQSVGTSTSTVTYTLQQTKVG